MDHLMSDSDTNVQTASPGPCCSRPGYNTGRTQGHYPSPRNSTCTLILALASLAFFGLSLPQPALAMQPRLRYLEYHCSKTIGVYSELLLALKPTHLLPEVRKSDSKFWMSCKVVLRAPPGSRIFLHFLLLRVSTDQNHHDKVIIKDGLTALTPTAGLYGNLDRSLDLQDRAGSKVKDYRSSGNEITVEYVGVPTAQHPGFRILVTVFKSPDSNGECPRDHFKCPIEVGICVPFSAACDGYSNCGMDDAGDEKNCDNFETATDLIEDYSLVYDIVVMTILPVVVFILVTVTALCCMRRYIRLKITIQTTQPQVYYTSANGGEARVKLTDEKTLSRLYAPPSYEDVVTPSRAAMMAPPPAYSTLQDRVRSGEVEVIDSEDEMYRLTPRSRKRLAKVREARLHERRSCHDSISSLDEGKCSPHLERKRHHERSANPYKGSYDAKHHHVRSHVSKGDSVRASDTDDDEDRRERRNKKKGGKPKRTVCAKRRADDLVNDNHTCAGDAGEYIHLLTSHHLTSHNHHSAAPPSGNAAGGSSPKHQSHSASPPQSARCSKSSPGPSTTRASSPPPSPKLPPPPTYSNIDVQHPPKYQPRATHVSQSHHQDTNSFKSGSVSSPSGDFPVPRGIPGKSAQGASVPCVVEMNPCVSTSTTPKSSPKDVPGSNPSSPSPSSCSTNDQDQSIHSETESRPASNTNSRTESNGSIADQFVNHGIKEKLQNGAAPETVVNSSA